MLMNQAPAVPIGLVLLLLFALLTFPSSSLRIAAAGLETRHILDSCLSKMASWSWRSEVDVLAYVSQEWRLFRAWLEIFEIVCKKCSVPGCKIRTQCPPTGFYPVVFLSGLWGTSEASCTKVPTLLSRVGHLLLVCSWLSFFAEL